MNSSAASSRSVLVARARKHFVAIAATSVVLTGGVAAYAATSGAAAQASPTGTGSQGSSKAGDSSGSGLTAPATNSSSDGSSNAS
jgi:hypothetical protein